MRFRTRVFLLWLLPVAVLLCVSFWMIEGMVQAAVYRGLRDGLRQNHVALATVRARAEERNGRFLRIAGENTALKAGLQLMLVEPGNPAAQATLEDELMELCGRMGFDLFVATSPDRTPLAGVARVAGRLRALPGSGLPPPRAGLFPVGRDLYRTVSVPIELGGEPLGVLIVGELFGFSGFSTPAVLMKGARVVRSSVTGVGPVDLEAALRACPGDGECDVRIRGVTHLSLVMPGASPGEGYTLRSLQNVDAAIQPVRSVLRWMFVSVFLGAVVIAILCGAMSARSIERPISALIAHLRRVEHTGVIPAFEGGHSGIREIEELTRTFNDAATAALDARQHLQNAYVQFVATLAMALDARDRYTAGHSERVSALSVRIAEYLGLSRGDVERIRIGALLHDIGKVGISDTVLLKPGALTPGETAVVRQHPEIGRRILEKVKGFSEWLNMVELHHENWDGTGYPRGLRGEAVPLDARIVHVADAYDAMTTDRPYRQGMDHECAIATLMSQAGLQFDPGIVRCLTTPAQGQPARLIA